MMHEFCTSKTKSIVLGDWPEDWEKNKAMALARIKGLILGGSVMPEKEDGPFFLKRSEYDFKKNCFIKEPEYTELEISRTGNEISVKMK